VLALLAAGVFPENLVHDIESRGTAFALDDNFSALATAAGADAVVMAALRKAKNNPPASSESPADQATLRRISSAGGLIRSSDYAAAAKELNGVSSDPATKYAVAFLMGELLGRGQRFAESAEVAFARFTTSGANRKSQFPVTRTWFRLPKNYLDPIAPIWCRT
jgi:hypothetical protein